MLDAAHVKLHFFMTLYIDTIVILTYCLSSHYQIAPRQCGNSVHVCKSVDNGDGEGELKWRKEDGRESFKRETVHRNCVKKGCGTRSECGTTKFLAHHSLSPLTYKKLSTLLV